MDDYEALRSAVQARIAGLQAERDRDRLLAQARHATPARRPAWRRTAAAAGLILIRLGAWLRGEHWLPASTATGPGLAPPSGTSC